MTDPAHPQRAQAQTQGEVPRPPAWLARLFWSSLMLAVMAFCALTWLRWGLVSAMARDAWRYCF